MAKIDDSVKKKVPELRFPGFTDDWEERKLTDVTYSYSGLTYSPTDVQDKGTFVLRSSNVKNDQLIDADNVYVNPDIVNSNNVKVGDVIVVVRNGSRSLIGKHAIVTKEMPHTVIGAFMSAFRGENGDYINALLSTNNFQKEIHKSLGATINQITGKDFSMMNFLTPKLEEQNKIGSFFKQLDNTITLHQRKLDLLKEQKKGYLQKMFPKNGAKVPELRFAGFADDWEEHKLGDYIIQYSEKTKQNNQYPVFTSSRNGLFFQKDYYKGNQIASEDNIGYNIVPRGYFTYRHMSDDLVFKFNINDLADYGIVSTLYPVFTTNEQLNSKYLQYQLNEGSEFRRFSLLQKQGGSRTYMYLNKLQNMILNIPKLEEQQKIGSFFQQLDETIALHQRKLDLLKEQKKGFLQKMFV